MAKKRFGIDQVTNQAISETMQMAKDHDSKFINTEIFISKIDLDPDNPRKHKISRSNIENGLDSSDPEYNTKKEEYEGLSELATSIKKDGLLHPVVVFKSGDNYKLVAGERRFLASIIADRSLIEARVFKTKPRAFDLKVIQWAENESRKDLSIFEKLQNVSAIIETYKSESGKKVTAEELSKIINTSRQLAQYYMAILSNHALMGLIREGKVTKISVARELVKLESKPEILQVLDRLPNTKVAPKLKPVKAVDKTKTAGRKRQKVTLGTTNQPYVAKTIVESVLSIKEFKKHIPEFNDVDWSCLDQSTSAFQKLVKLLEKELGALV